MQNENKQQHLQNLQNFDEVLKLPKKIISAIKDYNSKDKKTNENFKDIIALLSRYDTLLSEKNPYDLTDHVESLRAVFQDMDLSNLTKNQQNYIQSFERFKGISLIKNPTENLLHQEYNDSSSLTTRELKSKKIIGTFLSDRIQEDKLLKKSEKIVASKKEKPLLYAAQRIDFHLKELRKKNKTVHLADAAVNAIIEYRVIQENKYHDLSTVQKEVENFEKTILTLCSTKVKKEITAKLDREIVYPSSSTSVESVKRPSQDPTKPKPKNFRETFIAFLSKNLILPGQNNVITLKINDPLLYEKHGKIPPNLSANSNLEEKKYYLEKIIETYLKENDSVPSNEFIKILPPQLIHNFFNAETIEARCKALTQIQLKHLLFSEDYLSKKSAFGGKPTLFEEFSINHSVQLDAIQFNSDKRPIIVFLYGNTDFYQRNLKEMKRIADLTDCRVIGFNLPGVGLSEGEVLSQHDMIDAAKAVIATLHKNGKGIPLEQIMLVGESMGAAVLTIAADEYSEEYHKRQREKPVKREEPHILNIRSFSTLAKAAVGFVTRNKTIGNLLAAIVTPILKSLDFELDAGKSYNKMKPENREHVFVKKNLVSDTPFAKSKSDHFISSFASINAAVSKEEKASDRAHRIVSYSTESHFEPLPKNFIPAFVKKHLNQGSKTHSKEEEKEEEEKKESLIKFNRKS